MFENRSYKRTFYSAPQSVTSLIAAFMEPTITVAVFLFATRWVGDPILRSDLTLCLLVFALTFPGRNRFKDNLLAAGTDIVTSWLVLLAILALCGYATNSLHYFDTRVLAAWAIATPVLQWASVWVGQEFLRRLAARSEARRSAVVVGAGPLGVKVSRALAESQDQGVDFVGYFDDRTDERLHGEAVHDRLGTLRDLAPYVRAHGIKEVYITLPLGSQPRIVELLEQVQGTTASIFFVPDVFGISIIQGRLQDMNGVPVVGICETPFTGTNELVKRVSDVVLAAIILVLISPLLLAIALGVKMSSPGPVIFKQRRNGLDGEEIVVYKFRTMRTMDDGHVVQGRMSIVGPRPHAVAHNEQYRQMIKAYMVRHKVKPGITGWAQVNGLRGETETVEKMRQRVEYDLEYLRNWSLGLDLQIIVRTARLVLFDRNAY
jgi:putative colanic acid biosynthesis UDP-glucose lipid carrier transferase